MSEYYNRTISEDGKGYRCKPCDNKARSDYNKRNPDRFRKLNINRMRKHKYGIETKDVEKMFNEQNGLCKICCVEMDSSFPITDYKRRQVIDHCHDSGQVRGLLCAKCNQALGLFNDNADVIEKASRYIKGTL